MIQANTVNEACILRLLRLVSYPNKYYRENSLISGLAIPKEEALKALIDLDERGIVRRSWSSRDSAMVVELR